MVAGRLTRGAWVAVCVSSHSAALARARGYLMRGPCAGGVQPALKPVVVLAGDVVESGPEAVTVDAPSSQQLGRRRRQPGPRVAACGVGALRRRSGRALARQHAGSEQLGQWRKTGKPRARGGAVTLGAWLALGTSLLVAVERTVTVMVVACPHALGLAVPRVVAMSTAGRPFDGLRLTEVTIRVCRTFMIFSSSQVRSGGCRLDSRSWAHEVTHHAQATSARRSCSRMLLRRPALSPTCSRYR